MEDPTEGLGQGEQASPPEVPAAPGEPAREGRLEEFQPRLWAKVVLLAALVIYVVSFVVANSGQVKVDFLVHKTHLSLIWLILLCLAIGLVGGLLISQMARRRRRRKGREADDRDEKRRHPDKR
jgi:uncharacterized integral membrane protein